MINLNPILLGMLASFPPHMRTIDALADAFANEFTTMQADRPHHLLLLDGSR